jgi:hypothetical protein
MDMASSKERTGNKRMKHEENRMQQNGERITKED